MAEKFFEDLIALGIPRDVDINNWLLTKLQSIDSICSIDEFTIFFLNLIKSQTDEFIKSNTSTCNTPRKPRLSMSMECQEITPIQKEDKDVKKNNSKRQSSRDLFGNAQTNFESPVVIKNSSFNSSTPVTTNIRKSLLNSSEVSTSTPKYNSNKNSFTQDKSSTFKNSTKNSLDFSSRNNSINKRNSSSPMCLGDFMNVSSNSTQGKSKKKTEHTPNFSKDEFPSLGEESMKKEKQKRRVAPLTVSKKCSSDGQSFVSSSFHSENNLLNVTPLDEIDIMSERRMLLEKREKISKDFKMEKEPEKNLHTIVRESLTSVISPMKSQIIQSTYEYDDTKVEKKDMLITLAYIYSFILDMNLVSNILTEFSYLFNLLNADFDPFENIHNSCQNTSIIETARSVLKNLNNCIFFTVNILRCQKTVFGLLDVMTIGVILDNERIQLIANDLHEFLKLKLQQKNQLSIIKPLNKSFTNNFVFFQQETDNSDNFPSAKEFTAFRKQRDMFYEVLRTWDTKHLDPTWDFKKGLETKIKNLITLMEHPINMAHLARLFTSQMIISCNFDDSNELQSVLGIDLGKLSKLKQRLVAPSAFSGQYLFPGSQAFFRDFIICCDNHTVFMAQLKISMVSELLQMNDSSIETVCISPGCEDGEEVEKRNHKEEFIVRAEIMTNMRILAKFIGFIESRPFFFEGSRNLIVDQKQSQIRNLLHPDFDVKRVLIRALNGSKLLVTIPWLVEYLAMLDFITIRLDYYRELFQILYSIYTRVNVVEKDRGSLCVLATSNFIIRACLGWLFEHSDIPEDYHSVSNMKHALKSLHQQQDSNERNTNETIDILRLHPLLENVLTAACPFLADLRIAMMPQRVTKVLSRTGRFRHITTKFQDKKQVEAKTQDGRAALVEAFLASQTPSVRKTVDFVIERTTSAVVKDFQVKYLIKIRKDAKTEVEKFAETVENVQKLTKEMTKIFSEFLIKLHDKWNIEVNENCRKRICGAFDSLMPFEMHTEVKNRLVGITYERTMSKVEEWRITNISTIVIFSKDIVSEATKLFIEKKHNQNNEMIKLNSNLIIDLSATSVLPSELFKKLQKILHESSLKRCESLRMEEVMEVFDMAVEIVEKQGLPSSAIRNISYFLLQLLILLIFNKSHFATRELKAKFFELCKNEKTSPFTNVSAAKSGDFIFSHLITPRLFITYQGRSRMSFEHYADFLIEIAKENFIVIDQLIEQSVQLYQYEWNNENLNEIAFFVERLKSSLPSHGTPAESQLFIELVADLARDMENF